jgi:phosphate uptake regulator
MSEFKRLWTKFARFAEALEGLDNPTGDYILSLRKRVDKLERDVEHLERQLHSSPGGKAAADRLL